MNDAADQDDSTNAIIGNSSRKRPLISESQEYSKTLPEAFTDTVYVSNLHPRIAEVHLQKLFERFGEIKKIQVLRKQVSRPSIAFVEFECSLQAVQNAIDKVNGQKLLGLTLHVSPAYGKKDSRITIGNRMSHDKVHTKKIVEDTQRKIDSIRKTLTNKDDVQAKP